MFIYGISFNNPQDPIGDQGHADGEDGDNQHKCRGRMKKFTRGLVFTIVISLTWTACQHTIKLCFELGKYRIESRGSPMATSPPMTIGPSLTPEPPPFSPVDLNDTITEGTRAEGFASPLRKPEGKRNKSKDEWVELFNAPFFVAWYISTWNVLFFPIFILLQVWCCNRSKGTAKKLFVESIQLFMDREYTLLQFFLRCALFCMLWVTANYLLVFTIRRLDTTVVMALYATTISMVYLLSWVVLHHQFVGIRIVAVIICDTGIALLAYMDGVDSRTLAAVGMALAASICTAIYKVFYKRTMGYTTYAQTSLFFTLVGFMNVLLVWPIVLILYLTGWETLQWDHIPWLPMSGAAALNLLVNLLVNVGVMWTYEVFLTLGLLFSIPISSVIDASVYEAEFKDMKLSGILLIMFGFLVVLLPDNWNQFLANYARDRIANWKRNEQIKKNGRVQDTTTAQISRLRTPSGRVK